MKIVPLIIALFYWSNSIAQDPRLYHQTNETNSMLLKDKGDLAISFSSLTSRSLNAHNFQLGYSPLKHLNIGGAYFREFGTRSGIIKGKNSSYSLSVGTHYQLKGKGKVNYDKHSEERIAIVEKGINLILNLGYSLNNMNSFENRAEKISSYSKVIKYHSFFAKAGALYNFGWGKMGLFGIVNFNKYKEITYNGNWEHGEYIEKVSNYFEQNDVIRVWSINFHSEMGKRMVKFIFGANIILSDQFGVHPLRMVEENRDQQAYLGSLIYLNKIGGLYRKIKQRKNKTK